MKHHLKHIFCCGDHGEQVQQRKRNKRQNDEKCEFHFTRCRLNAGQKSSTNQKAREMGRWNVGNGCVRDFVHEK